MIKTTIFDATGFSVSLELHKELTVEQVKAQALSELAPHDAGMKCSHHYKLVSSKSGRSLNDKKRLEDEVVYSNDELLLLRRNPQEEAGGSSTSSSPTERNLVKQISPGDEERFRAPSLTEIQLATACVPPMDISRPDNELPPKGEHRHEIRKIMVTLVEYSEVLLRDHPDVKPIFERLDEKLTSAYTACEPVIEPALIKKMTDMGFDQHLAKRALIAKKSCPAAALELLLSGQQDILYAEPSTAKHTKIPKAYAMLQCFQEYNRKMCKANQKAVENLKDMGFSEPDILDALRLHSNSQEAACNWLLSDRRATPEDLEVGLDPDGAIYKAIVANPVIQLGLCTPKVLIALLHILENPHCINRWINDVDTTPLLSHLFRIYLSDKTSLHFQ